MLTADAIKQVDGIEFLGSMARKTLYPIKPDILEYADVSMPAYDTYVDGELSKLQWARELLKRDLQPGQVLQPLPRLLRQAADPDPIPL